MKIFLYILLTIFLIIGMGAAWFFLYYIKVTPLVIPEGATQETQIKIVDTWLQDLQEKKKFNGVVLLAKEGKALLAKGYGYTDATLKDTLTADSAMRLASVSKQFTATGIMLLKEKGLLDYDDLVSKYILAFPYDKITVRHLLNQHSGLPEYIGMAKKKEKTIALLTNEKVVQLLIEENRPLRFSPNEKHEYCNTNYILLARLIEVISEKSFEEFMQEELFTPLGMRNTRVWNLLSTDKIFPNKTTGFSLLSGEAVAVKPDFIDGVAGDGAVFSSVNDLLIWDQFWYGNDLIGKDNLQEAFKKPNFNNGKQGEYGFGWAFGKKENVVWHNGAWLAAKTIIVRDMEKKTCIALLSNSYNPFLNSIEKELVKQSIL